MPVALQENLYNILLRLADERAFPEVSLYAGYLLGMLPTWPEIHASLRAAIVDSDAAAQLSCILCPRTEDGQVAGHARLLYLLEVSCPLHVALFEESASSGPAQSGLEDV